MKILALFSLLFFSINLKSEFKLDKNAQPIYTKFSDWIPNKLHNYEPKFLEDFYQIYGLKLLYKEADLLRNIHFLNLALLKRFRHPKNALCKVISEQQYHKYRLLMYMQIHLQIMRSYMRIASLYDKRHLYFYNLDFADDLEKSFKISHEFYQKARPYWKKARQYAMDAHKYPFEINLPQIETIRYDIITGVINFNGIIQGHIQNLEKKLAIVSDFLTKEGKVRPVKKWMENAGDPVLEKELEALYINLLKDLNKGIVFKSSIYEK